MNILLLTPIEDKSHRDEIKENIENHRPILNENLLWTPSHILLMNQIEVSEYPVEYKG